MTQNGKINDFDHRAQHFSGDFPGVFRVAPHAPMYDSTDAQEPEQGGDEEMVIDPLSQAIGALSSEVASLGRNMVDLRSEVITNRAQNQTVRDEFRGVLDAIRQDLTSVKHDYNAARQLGVIQGNKLEHIDVRLSAIETTITVWKTRAAIFTAGVVLISGVVGFIAQLVMSYIMAAPKVGG